MEGLSSKGFHRMVTVCGPSRARMAFSSRRLPTKHQGQMTSETMSMSMFTPLERRRGLEQFADRLVAVDQGDGAARAVQDRLRRVDAQHVVHRGVKLLDGDRT